MQTAGARIAPEDDPRGMSREAVLLEWERKIEEAERRPSRFERSDGDEPPAGDAAVVSLTGDATHSGRGRFQRRTAPSDAALGGERRTITITGRPTPPRRRRSVVENQLAQPDRIALWAFLLGLFLVAVAAGTAHA
jgi:hypothetical protein